MESDGLWSPLHAKCTSVLIVISSLPPIQNFFGQATAEVGSVLSMRYLLSGLSYLKQHTIFSYKFIQQTEKVCPDNGA